MKKFRLAVCKGPDCKAGGSDQVFKTVTEELGRAGLASRCQAYRGGCYGLCHLGPNVVIREDIRPRDPLSREDFQLMGWDDEVHYGAMTPEKVARIVEQHIGAGNPVTEWICQGDGDAMPGPPLLLQRK